MKLPDFLQTMTQDELAKKLSVTQATVSQWIREIRPVPVQLCVRIESLTENQVMRWDLRPDDWHLIWPELIGKEGAPPVPENSQDEQAESSL